jgi:site-specific DNA-methyltransferase (adenine-specific)
VDEGAGVGSGVPRVPPEARQVKPYYSEPGIDLYLGDNREVLAELGVLPGDVDLLWGDVPYGISVNTRRSARPRPTGVPKGGKNWSPVAGDARPFNPALWLDFPRAVLWGANHYADRLPASASWWCWDKRTDLIPERDQADGELAWTNLGGPARIFRYMWDGLCQASKEHNGGRRVHPTQKPEALATWGFQRAGLQPGRLVLSPWLGSGPEAAAAKRLGLRFIGVELVREYLDACVDRLRQDVLPLASGGEFR